jgi:hypothetical protein
VFILDFNPQFQAEAWLNAMPEIVVGVVAIKLQQLNLPTALGNLA